MKIILEGTEAEFRSLLHSFGIPKEVVFDDGSQFICGDLAGRGHRRKKSVRTFKVIKKQFGDAIKDYSSSKEVPNKPEPLEIEFMSDSDSDKIKALTKEQANRRREVRQKLNSLKQDIPEAVIGYFSGKDVTISFNGR